MLPRTLMLTLSALASLGVAVAVTTGTASAQEKKVIKKGSGQFEEHYELLPPEEGEPDAGTAPDAGSLDPEGDAPPPAAATKSVKRAPTAAPKGAFGAPVPAGGKSRPVTAPEPAPEPEPDGAVDATVPMEEDEPPARPAAATAKKTPAEADDEPGAPAAKQEPRPAATPKAATAARREPTPAPAADEAPSETAFFRAALDEGGSWSKHPRYRDVFVPDGGSDWRPYTAGRWIYDAALGWAWISDEAHGWATYHYGRWGFETGLGWFWVPGTEWAPSWVVWRQGQDAIGWAPLPPAAQFGAKGLSLDANIIESDAFERAWVFVAPRYFGQQVMRRFIRPLRWNADLVDRTVPSLGYQRKDGSIANRGLAIEDASRLAGNPPQRMTLSVSPDTRFKKPQFRSGEEVKIYRPDERQIAELTRKATKMSERSAQGTSKPSQSRSAGEGTSQKRFAAPPKAERTETAGGVTESWVKPETQPKPKAADAPAAPSTSETPAKSQRAFAPAPVAKRTESNGAVTESWAESEPHPPKSAKRDAAPAATTTAGSTTPATPHKAAPGNTAREESYSVPGPDEVDEATPAAPASASQTQTGSTAKRRWDSSGASGGPGMVPGAAP